MYAFNTAAIFPPGHPYIESTTVLSDYSKGFVTEIELVFVVLLLLTGWCYR